MDLSGMVVDQDPPESGDSISAFMSFAAAPRSPVDQVKWQGSQTGCHALNQLIKLSTDELPSGDASSRAGVNRGWQRLPSHELLADFSSSNGIGSTSTARSKPSSSSRPLSSSRMPPSRARLRDSRTPAPDPGSKHSPLPLLDKTNPMQFLDILKGVSARLDENAGIQAKRDTSTALAARASRKRVRGSGIANLPESGSSRRRYVPGEERGKTRLSAHSTHDSFIFEKGSANDKGKGKAIETERITRIKGLALQGHSSLPDMASPSSGFGGASFRDGDSSFMDVDSSFLTGSDSTSPTTNDRGHVDLSFLSSSTPSQVMMPPPTVRPTKSPFVVENQGRTSSTTSSDFLTAQQPQPHPSHRPPQIPPPAEVRPPKPEPVPKLHPLLSQKQSHAPVPAPAPAPVPQAVTPRFFVKDPSPVPPSSSIPLCGSQSTRAPALGMRRTHTFPSKSVPAQRRQNGLPMRQRGFKPPLLSPDSAARQEAAKQNRLAQIQASINSIEQIPDCRQPAPIKQQRSGSVSSDPLRVCLSSSGSSSGSSNSFNSSTKEKAAVAKPSGPVDTDPDSSFGDMSFDMDALEETMRMYD